MIIIGAIVWSDIKYKDTSNPNSFSSGRGDLKSAVLYAGNGLAWKDTYSHLAQSLLVNLSVESINVEIEDFDFSTYDLIYLDSSIRDISNKFKLKNALIQFTTEGGGLFLENELWDFFDKDFVGAKEFVKLDSAPKSIEFPATRDNLKAVQEILKDFDNLYKDYIDYEIFDTYDYGYGIKDAKGEVLAEENDIALYTVNKVGKGYVFFTNPLLPNYFNINGFSMKATKDLQKYFANTTASANQLLRNGFAGFISKEKYGLSVERVFGSYGRPSMAWQLHYEEITGIENNSASIFTEILKKNLQIPSFTIVRNSYTWFKRSEAITYLLNDGNDEELKFSMDEYENAYSSGKHLVSDGEFLSLDAEIENGGSYFVDYPEYDLRAYPFPIDYNNDGLWDIISGSSDGDFYYFQGTKMGDNYETSKAIKIKDSSGELISVKGYSAPILTYIDGDKSLDLISGSIDGKIHWFSGNGDLTFDSQGILVDTAMDGQMMPAIGDINGDGIDDLIIGSNTKTIKVYYGENEDGNLSFIASSDIKVEGLENIEGNWLAPYIIDINNDGTNDLVVGTFHGYIAKFIGDGKIFKYDGYIEGTEKNYKGNSYLKFGNNSIPTFGDINGDGKKDLIVGSLEYGLAYPIDSAYFPYKDNLASQIQFMKDNGHYVGLHLYTNEGASDEYEKKELEMHISALEQYGVSISDQIGFNQHTWHTSSESDTQTFENGFEAGLLWISGFKAPRSKAVPESRAETAITVPFFLGEDNLNSLLVFNTSTLLYDNKGWGDISAKYDLPVSLYYHCDFAYEKLEQSQNIALKAGTFANKYDYNFVTEEQYARAIAASYNTEVSVEIDNTDGKMIKIILTPKTKDTAIPLYDEDYQKAVGVKVVLGEKYKGKTFTTTSPIWYQNNDVIYMGVGDKTIITEEKPNEFHLTRVNLPADIAYLEDGVQLKFRKGGMMQVEVMGDATTKDINWIISKSINKDATIFTKYGEADTLNIEKID